jgi:hypothetical protein
VSEENSWYRRLEPKAADEARYIVHEFSKQGIEIGGVHGPADQGVSDEAANGVGFMYVERRLLAREDHVPEIQRVVRENGAVAHRVRQVVRGIVLLELTPERDDATPKSDTESSEDGKSEGGGGESGGDGGDSGGYGGPPERQLPSVLFFLDRIDEALGVGIATPDHVLTVANGAMGPCAATEPQEVYDDAEIYPAQCRDDGGAGVRIYIADTGLLDGAAETHSWMKGVDGDPDPRTEVEAGTGTGETILPYAGHGTFVAGVLRCMAPKAEIYVGNVFDIAGSKPESDLIPKLNKAFDYAFEIIHISVASPTRKNLPPLTLEAWVAHLGSYKGVVCVTPAGNNGNRRPCWPAAFPGTVSVGALAADWRSRADFSNYGGWVDLSAPGKNLVNAFASGTYICENVPYNGETRKFFGVAQWSGTSFSAPIVTGLIAARMSRCGENGQEAAAALLAEARSRAIPYVGPVLLPRCDADCDGCGRRPR